MERDLNSTRTSARPSHEAIENKVGTSKAVEKTEDQKVSRAAMKAAKRASNRIHLDEENLPGSTMFTK